jgi:hypothetical protein
VSAKDLYVTVTYYIKRLKDAIRAKAIIGWNLG